MELKRLYVALISLCLVALLLSSCAPSSSTSSTDSAYRSTLSASALNTPAQSQVYTDAKLGFQLTIPGDWQAQPQPGSQAETDNSAVTFTVDEQSTHSVIVIGVFHKSNMSSIFAARGTPTAHIGSYPAFIADRTTNEARAPCLVRIFLAGNDYVMADWCAPDASTHQAQFEQVLATYQPASSTLMPQTARIPQPQTCVGMQHQLGYSSVSWGGQLASPTASAWHQMNYGMFICSNKGSNDWYLFQCTELINRLLYERWALPHLPGNAARYLDYYQNGVLHQGVIHTFPTSSYQISDDASQGKSSFRPVAGDILVFQDVNNPHAGWTSGLIHSPGHVAIIVGVDDAHIYIAQENYNNTQYFLALPMHKVANGYKITDLSGWSQRIVRGWIHFTVNGGPLTTA
ncbi:MAG TPA: CHAP domain-containing protein [Ktedonobacteraceae bacterium]|nr:CHAP domain-containing protein [Ktedonobacteraceae bacterium]